MKKREIGENWTPILIRAYVRLTNHSDDPTKDFEVRVPGARLLEVGIDNQFVLGNEYRYVGSFKCSAYKRFVAVADKDGQRGWARLYRAIMKD